VVIPEIITHFNDFFHHQITLATHAGYNNKAVMSKAQMQRK